MTFENRMDNGSSASDALSDALIFYYLQKNQRKPPFKADNASNFDFSRMNMYLTQVVQFPYMSRQFTLFCQPAFAKCNIEFSLRKLGMAKR